MARTGAVKEGCGKSSPSDKKNEKESVHLPRRTNSFSMHPKSIPKWGSVLLSTIQPSTHTFIGSNLHHHIWPSTAVIDFKECSKATVGVSLFLLECTLLDLSPPSDMNVSFAGFAGRPLSRCPFSSRSSGGKGWSCPTAPSSISSNTTTTTTTRAWQRRNSSRRLVGASVRSIATSTNCCLTAPWPWSHDTEAPPSSHHSLDVLWSIYTLIRESMSYKVSVNHSGTSQLSIPVYRRNWKNLSKQQSFG